MAARMRERSSGTVRLAREGVSLVLGTVLTLVLLEGSIRFGAAAFVYFQAERNLAAIGSGEGEVRILCVGESTTAVAGDEVGQMLVTRTAYPTQLETILNSRQSTIKFRVLNDGIMGGTTGSIIELLDSTLDDLKPHIIIAMMGIKDTPTEWVPVSTLLPDWMASLHSVRLLSWVIEDVKLRQNAHPTQIRTLADLPPAARAKGAMYGNYIREVRPRKGFEIDKLKAAVYLYHIGRIKQAEEILRGTIADHGVGYPMLTDILAGEGRYEEAVALMEDGVAQHPSDGFYALQLAHLYLQHTDYDAARALLAAATVNVGRFDHPELVMSQFRLEIAELALAELRFDDALLAVAGVTGEVNERYHDLVPAVDVLVHSTRGRAYAGKKDWAAAEVELLDALNRAPNRHVNMWLLSSVYRATGQTEKEESVRRDLLAQTGRVAEYFELAKLFRLTGHPERVPEVLAEAVRNTPSLKENHRYLYDLAEIKGIQLIVMQYPSFELDALHAYAPEQDGVVFIDNQHVFDADPEAYFFQPTYPQSFTHYTQEGARVLAEHVADTIIGLHQPASPPE